MTKPLTVAQAMRNLTDSITPPIPAVKLHVEQLKGGAEVIRYALALGMVFQLRTLTVWGFLALFFPGLGITWFMVMFGLYAVRHLVPPRNQIMVDAIARQRK